MIFCYQNCSFRAIRRYPFPSQRKTDLEMTYHNSYSRKSLNQKSQTFPLVSHKIFPFFSIEHISEFKISVKIKHEFQIQSALLCFLVFLSYPSSPTILSHRRFAMFSLVHSHAYPHIITFRLPFAVNAVDDGVYVTERDNASVNSNSVDRFE